MSTINRGLKSTITHTPSVSAVSAFILASNGVDALNFAMSQLVDAGITWTLDISNKRIIYVIAGRPAQTVYKTSTVESTAAPTAQESCMLYRDVLAATNNSYAANMKFTDGKCVSNSLTFGQTISTIPGTQPVEKYIPIDTVSTQILANAVAGNHSSQEALTQITINKFANDEFTEELDANATPFSE